MTQSRKARRSLPSATAAACSSAATVPCSCSASSRIFVAFREAHHIGLKEAKDVVEQYMDANPQVKQRMAAANAESARGFLGWVVLVAALALAAYYFYAGSR